MTVDAWPPFHADPEHYPASHPVAIEDCPDCRPAVAEPIDGSYQLAQAVRQYIAGVWDQLADVFDWLAPGTGAGLRAMLLAVQNDLEDWVHATAIYGKTGAATELDYYQGDPT